MIFNKEEIDSWPQGTKRCRDCLQILPFSVFAVNRSGVLGRRSACRECRGPEYRAQYLKRTFEDTMLKSAQQRAKDKGRVCDITIDDIVIPEICPILNVPIQLVRNSQYGPSLDRINSDRGYTKDNIIVMSRRANVLKNNMTLDEAKLLLYWLEHNQHGR
jgi:hypothetical protein